MKIEIKEQNIKGTLEINDKKYNYIAYPLGLELTTKLLKAQKLNDQLLFLEVIGEYFDKNIEFEKNFLSNPKEEVKQLLDRSGELANFVTKIWDELGKQKEVKD